ncbi:MAG: hypothetical protein KatS3mg014_2751 [Actinomycetota bacterium]|nr:MAG: hypothetical protein KatS3mg014_2751 [Actinomycetota bacterium]
MVGDVRVAPIRVRTALRPWPTDETPPPGYRERYRRMHIIGAMRGVPSGLHGPDGWVVRTGCLYPEPVTEAVVTLTKTGPAGGGIRGIVVTYGWDGQLHRFTIPVEFGICGTDTGEWCH